MFRTKAEQLQAELDNRHREFDRDLAAARTAGLMCDETFPDALAEIAEALTPVRSDPTDDAVWGTAQSTTASPSAMDMF